jgi:hypothetical protein
MFHRGQRIIIKKSSASKRAHPSVGDIGYIGSAFLFYRNRFILIDGEFFSYSDGLSIDTVRKSERKRFIIDLGMSAQNKRLLKTEGMPRKWFLSSKYVVNLNPVEISVNAPCADRPAMSSMWPRMMEQAGNIRRYVPLLDKKVKIPVGQIALFTSDRKYATGTLSPYEMRAWLRVMSPVIDMSYRASDNMLDKDDAYHRMYVLYQAVDQYLNLEKEYKIAHQHLFRLSTGAILSRDNQRSIVEIVRQIQAIAAMQWLKKESFLINNYISSEAKNFMRSELMRAGLSGLINGDIRKRDPSDFWDIASTVLCRALVMKGNTCNRLMSLKDILYISDQWFVDISKEIDKMKEEAISDSAALARIFDGTLIG